MIQTDPDRIAKALKLLEDVESRKAELERLTTREREVLHYVAKGFDMQQLAGLLSLSRWTVNDHLKGIYKKLDVSSRAEAAVVAAKAGMA